MRVDFSKPQLAIHAEQQELLAHENRVRDAESFNRPLDGTALRLKASQYTICVVFATVRTEQKSITTHARRVLTRHNIVVRPQFFNAIFGDARQIRTHPITGRNK